MTIKEYAVSKAVTTGAIYKAVSRSGHSAKELTDRKGQITGKGLSILREIYPDEQEPDQEPLSEPLKETRPEDSALDELRERLSEAERARDRAEADLQNEKERSSLFEKLYNEAKDDLKRQQESAEREIASMHDRIRDANRLLSQQQELERLRTMNPIKRLFAGRKKEKPDQTVDGSGQVN